MTGLVWNEVVSGHLELPVESLELLTAIDLAEAAHHRKMWSVLEEATGILADRGVSAVAFKGITDEMRWFSREGERPCNDIDLLVSIDDFDAAIDALASHHPLAGRAADLAHRAHIRSVNLVLGDIPVDLHVDPIKVGTGWREEKRWMSHTVEVSSPSGNPVTVFDHEALATIKLLHLGRDRFRTLLGVVEMGRIFEKGLDWEVVMDLAGLEGIDAAVAVSAEIVAEELGIDLSRPHARGLRPWMWRRLWHPDTRLLGEIGRVRHIRRSQWGLPLMMPGRTLETIRWLLSTAIPPEELFDLEHPDLTGPYAWRATGGRAIKLMRRRMRAYRRGVTERSP